MIAAGDLARITEVCKAIGNEVTDDSGFVPMRNLLSRFHAQLLIRPLLVEGMLASVEQHNSPTNSSPWAVLIDSETYPFSERDILEERPTRPLPYRMRNTIAHELVHSLAFRASDFGIRLKGRTDTKETLREFVKAVELETERLSPLLLWSEKALTMLLHGKKEALSLFDLLQVLENAVVSRYVLVNRLLLLRKDSDELLFSSGLRNLAVGLGVWAHKKAQVKGWPLFWNFDDGIVPSFLLKVRGHERLPAENVFLDETFAMLGGPNNVAELETSAGTQAVPQAKKMRVQVAVEEGLRKLGEEFLFVVRKLTSS
jgi:hypothetical protein